MRPMNWLLAAALGGLSIAAAQEPAAQRPKKPVSDVKAAVRVVADPASGLANQTLLTHLFTDPSIVAQVVAKVAPDAAEPGAETIWPPGMTVGNSFGSLPPGVVIFKLHVYSYDARLPADKLLSSAIEVLGTELVKLDTQYQTDMEQAKKYDELVTRMGNDLKSQKLNSAKLATIYKMPSNAALAGQQEGRLDAQREALQIESQGLIARKKVLEEQIADMGGKASAEAAKDPVAVELEKAVQIRERVLATRREGNKQSVVSLEQKLEAEGALIAAKAELAKFRREIAQSGGQRIAELRRRLEDASADLAECEAKREALITIGTRAGNPDLALKRIEVELLESEYRQTSGDLLKLKTKLRFYRPPTITLVSGAK